MLQSASKSVGDHRPPMFSAWQVAALLDADSRLSTLKTFIGRNISLWHYEHQLTRRDSQRGRRNGTFVRRLHTMYDLQSNAYNEEKKSLVVSSSDQLLREVLAPLDVTVAGYKDILRFHDAVHTNVIIFVETINRQFPTKSGPRWRFEMRCPLSQDGKETVEYVEQRRQLVMRDANVQSIMESTWALLPKDHRGFLSRSTHARVFYEIFKVLAFDVVDEVLRMDLVRKDWDLRAAGRLSIDRARFIVSMRCTIDVWCETNDPNEAVEFISFVRGLCKSALLRDVTLQRGHGLSSSANEGGGSGDATETQGVSTIALRDGRRQVQDLMLRTLGRRNVGLHSASEIAARREQLDEEHRKRLRGPLNASAGTSVLAPTSHSESSTAAFATNSLVSFVVALTTPGTVPKFDVKSSLTRRMEVTEDIVASRGTRSRGLRAVADASMAPSMLLPPTPVVLLKRRAEITARSTDGDSSEMKDNSFSSKGTFASMKCLVPRKIKTTLKPSMESEFLDRYNALDICNHNSSPYNDGETTGNGRRVRSLEVSVGKDFIDSFAADTATVPQDDGGGEHDEEDALVMLDSVCASPAGSPHNASLSFSRSGVKRPDGCWSSSPRPAGDSFVRRALLQSENRPEQRSERLSTVDGKDDDGDSDVSIEEALTLVERHYSRRQSEFRESRLKTRQAVEALRSALTGPVKFRDDSSSPVTNADASSASPGMLTTSRASSPPLMDTAAAQIPRMARTTVSFRVRQEEATASPPQQVPPHSASPSEAQLTRDVSSTAPLCLLSASSRRRSSQKAGGLSPITRRRSTLLSSASMVSLEDDAAFEQSMLRYVDELSANMTADEQERHRLSSTFEDADASRYVNLQTITLPVNLLRGLSRWRGPMHCTGQNDVYQWYDPRVYGVVSCVSLASIRRFANPFIFAFILDVWSDARLDEAHSDLVTTTQRGALSICEGTVGPSEDHLGSATPVVSPPPLHQTRHKHKLQLRWFYERLQSCDDVIDEDSVNTAHPASLHAADWVPFNDAHSESLTQLWMDGEECVVPLLPSPSDVNSIAQEDAAAGGGATPSSFPPPAYGFDYSPIRDGKRCRMVLSVDFLTWRCGYDAVPVPNDDDEDNCCSTDDAPKGPHTRRKSSFSLALSTKRMPKPSSETPPSQNSSKTASEHHRLRRGHRICAHWAYLWEYRNPTATAWYPFPLHAQTQLTDWLQEAKAYEARCSQTPASVVHAAAGSVWSTTVSTTLLGLHKYREHCLSLLEDVQTDDGRCLAMTCWSGSKHLTVPVRYHVLFFNKSYSMHPLRLDEAWRPTAGPMHPGAAEIEPHRKSASLQEALVETRDTTMKAVDVVRRHPSSADRTRMEYPTEEEVAQRRGASSPTASSSFENISFVEESVRGVLLRGDSEDGASTRDVCSRPHSALVNGDKPPRCHFARGVGGGGGAGSNSLPPADHEALRTLTTMREEVMGRVEDRVSVLHPSHLPFHSRRFPLRCPDAARQAMPSCVRSTYASDMFGKAQRLLGSKVELSDSTERRVDPPRSVSAPMSSSSGVSEVPVGAKCFRGAQPLARPTTAASVHSEHTHVVPSPCVMRDVRQQVHQRVPSAYCRNKRELQRLRCELDDRREESIISSASRGAAPGNWDNDHSRLAEGNRLLLVGRR